MEKRTKKQNKLYVLIPILILLVPLVQKNTEFIEIEKLHGAINVNKKPDFGIEQWFSGKFQQSYESYINDNIGFRNLFVRLYNQIRFSVFRKPNAKGVIIGKNNFLYEKNYISAYYGLDYIGDEEIKENSESILKLQNQLDKYDITLLICFAPGKASFYPEYIPDKLKHKSTFKTNYLQYKKYLEKLNVNFIDFNKWFIELKDTSSFVLYPKYGIHWSHYGSLLCADSIINYIEEAKNLNMPNIELSNFTLSKYPRYSDYDIGDGLNLKFKLKSEEYCYPDISWETGNNIIKPRVLVISDSFYWVMINFGIESNAFTNAGFWFYNKQVYPESYNNEVLVENVDIVSRVLKNDVIILMVTEANLSKFNWGFTKELLPILENPNISFDNNKQEKLKNDLQNIILTIKKDTEWYNTVIEKAKNRKISIDSMLYLDALWVLNNDK